MTFRTETPAARSSDSPTLLGISADSLNSAVGVVFRAAKRAGMVSLAIVGSGSVMRLSGVSGSHDRSGWAGSVGKILHRFLRFGLSVRHVHADGSRQHERYRRCDLHSRRVDGQR